MPKGVYDHYKIRGVKRPAEVGRNISAAKMGHNVSKETKDKLRVIFGGKPKTEEFTAAMKVARNEIPLKSRITRNALQARARNGTLIMSKPEIELEELLELLLPGQYCFVGHGDFILAGKCPDFVNVNGQKKVIEMFGDNPWHSQVEVGERTELFTEFGYETLVIWDYELKDFEVVKDKVLLFNQEKKK